ncbi:hypothetical protein BDZ89DRAFT_765834 [Hymenopellis radicata]|nr:hypothetical protein BDZ89DRAFT_765834 [Hymenopellis radicata]
MLCTGCASEVRSPKAGELYPDALDHRGALEHLENTNEPATDADVSLVSSIVLPAIQNKRDEFLASIRRLQDACSRLSAEEARYKNLISPCRRLPREILAEIFQHACIFDTDDIAYSYPGSCPGIFNPQAAQWTIPRVCMSWRTVILNCQAIWSTIRVIEPHYASCFESKHVDALTLTLSRSRSHLLDVVLKEKHHGFWDSSGTNQIPDTSPYRHCRTIFETIFAESHRWRTAVLYLSGKGTRNAFVSLHGRLPNLTNLALRVTESKITTPIVITGFSDCPRLHTVELQRLVETDVRWSQILHVVVIGNMLHENMRQESSRTSLSHTE